MSHKLHPIESILVQEGYNIRPDAEVKANAKEVAATMEARGDIPELFPITYVVNGNKKFTRNHATLLAAQMRGWKEVYAANAPWKFNSVTDIADLVLSNNGGHPIGRESQGKIYADLRDGVLEPEADTLKRTKVGEEPIPQYERDPMPENDIAKLFGKSPEHIRQCIAIHEAPESVKPYLDDDSISHNAFIAAKNLVSKHHDGKESKLLQVVKRTVAAAKEDGKDKATPKHFDSIKAEFIPEKKLVAAPVEEITDTAPAASAAPESPAAESEAPTNSNAPETKSDAPALFDTKTESKAKKPDASRRKSLETLLLECSDEFCWSASDEDISATADKLEAFFASNVF